jgi:hypothetical protein
VKLNDTIFFFGTSGILFLKKHISFGSLLHFCFQANKHLTWWTPYIKLLAVTGYHRNRNLLRYVSEDRFPPMIANRKIATTKLKINKTPKIKPGRIYKLKTIRDMNSD